jgi:hypothetical protein
MSISSITGTSGTSATSSIQFQPSIQASSTDAPPSGDTTAMSGIAQFMSKLSSLEQSNPDQAKQVLSTIASKLNDAAGSATGDQAAHLKDLAAKFTQAADTGDLSGIQPPQGGGGHHHHHHAKPAAAPDDSSTSSDTSGASAGAAAITEKYKAAGAKPDLAALDKMFEDAFSSVTGTAAAAS